MTEILRRFGWWHILDLGDITTARGTEMYLPMWLRMCGALGTGTFKSRLCGDRSGRRPDLPRHRRHLGDREGDRSGAR